jgi:hypothetical protein
VPTTRRSELQFDSPRYRQEWRVKPDQLPIRCEEHDTRDRHICRDCAEDLHLVLADLPVLVFDLQLALTRQTHFVEHGHQLGGDDGDGPQEATGALPWAEPAAAALRHLGRALGGPRASVWPVERLAARTLARWDDLLLAPTVVEYAERVSLAALHGYRVIDRPPDPWFYGPCPKCAVDIYDERNVTRVSCLACTYTAPLDEHQLACLDAGDARLLTVSELVGAITSAGEVVTRHQIFGWIRRDGLAREEENRVVWRKGRLAGETVWVYRLGDVRRLARAAEERKAS